jgi:hypothetical protein
MKVTGGIQVGPDQRVHPAFTHNPSSGRLAGDMMQIPRGGSVEERYVKDMFVAPRGSTFWARDFSGIEARLVGYFSGSRRYTWLTGIDVHSYYTIHALHELDGVWSANDLPDMDWPEDKLRDCLRAVKTEFKFERNNLYKHLVHGANYMQTPIGAVRKIFKDTGKVYDLKRVARVMDIYLKDLFPEIPRWHKALCAQVDGTKKHEADVDETLDPWSLGVCYAKNPFDYIHRFYNVLNWEKMGSEWVSSFGDDAKRLVSFLPQSTAAAIIKKASRKLWYEHPDVGETLRLLIHDEIFGECYDRHLEHCLAISGAVMEAPIEELPLNPDWNMGEFMVIGTEPKTGSVWSQMH